MINLRNFLCVTTAIFLFSSGSALAQVAPAPQRSPRTPVSKQELAGKTSSPALPASRTLTGQATILDTERLKIQGVEVRLFGVVPPLMGASYGPQARAALDSLAQSNVTCQVKDRTRDGHFLALCNNETNADFGLELLRRGLAASARGTLGSTPYAGPYQAAEAAAQAQHLGIWSASMPKAASESSIRDVMQKAQAAKIEAEKAKAEAAKAKEEIAKAKAEAQELQKLAEQSKVDAPPAPTTVMQLGSGVSTSLDSSTVPSHPSFEESVEDPTIDEMLSNLADPIPAPALQSDMSRGFFERYQLLLSGLLLFGTTIVLSVAFAWNKRRQKQEDLRSIAAALHGELMAARSVCLARLSKIAQEGTDRNTTWPRIRVLVFQAYIGRLGCLGAELSRQIASIYGMASDYASYYNTNEPRAEGASKRQALEALVQYIEEVTPRLARIEKEGELPSTRKPLNFKAALKAPARPLSLASKPAAPDAPSGGPGNGAQTPKNTASNQMNAPDPLAPRSKVHESLSEAKIEIVSETVKPQAKIAEAKAPQAAKPHAVKKVPEPKVVVSTAAMPKKKLPTTRKPLEVEKAAQAAIKAVAAINFKDTIIEKLSQMKSYASSKLDFEKKPTLQTIDDFTIPDYANLTEEELEALLYAEEEMSLATPVGKWQQTG